MVLPSPQVDRTHAATRRPVRVGIVLLAWAAAFAGLWLAREVLLLGFLGLLIAVVFSFPVGWLSRWMPRGVAVLLVLLLLGGMVAGLGALAAPILSREAGQLRERAPKAINSFRGWLERVQTATTGQGQGQNQGQGRNQTQGQQGQGGSSGQKAPEAVARIGEKALPALISFVSGVTAIVLVIVLGAFLVYQPDVYRRGVRSMIPPAHESTFDEAWTRVGRGLRKWVGGILVAMTLMGTVTAVGLALAGIEGWLLLAVLTFLGTFVPYVGAVASAVPGILSGLAQSPRHFVLAILVYVGVHVIEGYIVEPFVMRKAVQVRPALLLFGQGVMSAVFGLLGTVVTTPMLVCGQILVEYLWVERRLAKPPP